MTPEASAFFAKAWECLRYAQINLDAGLGNDAGRNAYLAALHAARAMIFERTGKLPKTHRGVHAEFNRLAKAEPRIDRALRHFLTEAYNLKAVADYETGADSVVPLDHAAAATGNATRFVECVASLL